MPPEKYELRKKKRIKNKRIPSWGRVQMTQQAEIRRTIKYVLAVSTRWLLHRRRDTKKINMRGCREKKRKDRKEKRKTRYLVVYMHRILNDTPRRVKACVSTSRSTCFGYRAHSHSHTQKSDGLLTRVRYRINVVIVLTLCWIAYMYKDVVQVVQEYVAANHLYQ